METEFQERCPGIGRGGGVGGNCYWSSNETIRLTDLDRNEGNPSLLGEEGVRVETVRRSVLPFLNFLQIFSYLSTSFFDVYIWGLSDRR